jgi:hypothetical protein
MNDILHNTANVAIALSVIQRTEFCRCLVVVGVCFELVGRAGVSYIKVYGRIIARTYDSMRAPLRANDPTHLYLCGEDRSAIHVSFKNGWSRKFLYTLTAQE